MRLDLIKPSLQRRDRLGAKTEQPRTRVIRQPLILDDPCLQENAQVPTGHRCGGAELVGEFTSAVRPRAQQLDDLPTSRIGKYGEDFAHPLISWHREIVADISNNCENVHMIDKAEPSTDDPTIAPMLAYENASAAIEFLTKAFGFTENFRFAYDDGRIGHAELSYGNGVVMLVDFGYGYEGPRHHAEHCETARRWHDNPYIVNGMHVRVDDVRAHFERAKSAGATILSEVEETPHGTLYRAADPEGQRWMFNQQS